MHRRFATKHIVPATGRLSAARHRWLVRRVERLWAVSGEVAARLRDLGAAPPALEVCHLGVDPGVYRPDPAARLDARAELGLREGERLVLCTSHLRPGKGVEILPRLAGELAGDPGGVVVAVAGDGPLRERIGDGRVRMLGVREDVPRLLAAADVFVFPTAGSEGLGLGALEAAAAEVPVVASAVSDLPEILGDEAELVPRGRRRAGGGLPGAPHRPGGRGRPGPPRARAGGGARRRGERGAATRGGVPGCAPAVAAGSADGGW